MITNGNEYTVEKPSAEEAGKMNDDLKDKEVTMTNPGGHPTPAFVVKEFKFTLERLEVHPVKGDFYVCNEGAKFLKFGD